MKWFKTLVKNLKILLRSRGSAMMVLLAPLLIVLIVGLSFAGNKENMLEVGVYTNNNSNDLSQRFLDNLNTSKNHIVLFPSSESCIEAIKEGVVVTCIVFPTNFVVQDNKTNEVVFYVDESRLNLAYQLISSMTFSIGGESEEVSQEITQRMLSILAETKINVSEGISSTVSAKAKLKSIEGKSSDVKGSVSDMDFTTEELSIESDVEGLDNLSDAVDNLEKDAALVISDGFDIVEALESTNVSSSSLEDSLNDLNESLNSSKVESAKLSDILSALNDASDEVEAMQAKLKSAETAKTSVSSNLDKLSSDVKAVITDVDSLKTRLEYVSGRLNSFGYTSASSISSPITTKVESVVAKNNKITYSFPYLLMLVVLFVGIMLASTIVFMEKDSRAYFRNFTTPTKNAHFILMNYFTSLFIIIIQCAIILLAVYFGLHVPLLNNIEVTIALLLLGISIFILIGMIVGSLFNTSEAITMSTIAIGSVLLFLSNLVLPIETLSPAIKQLASYNPYVIVSESMKRTMLMDAGFSELSFQFMLLGIYVVVLLLIVVFLKKISSSKIFEKLLMRKPKQVFAVPEDHYLKIEDKNIIIKSIPDLLETLKHMSPTDYNTLTKPKNIFSKWLKERLNEKRLALIIERKSLEKTIKVLENYLKKK